MVERSLSMREVGGSMPPFSTVFFVNDSIRGALPLKLHQCRSALLAFSFYTRFCSALTQALCASQRHIMQHLYHSVWAPTSHTGIVLAMCLLHWKCTLLFATHVLPCEPAGCMIPMCTPLLCCLLVCNCSEA